MHRRAILMRFLTVFLTFTLAVTGLGEAFLVLPSVAAQSNAIQIEGFEGKGDRPDNPVIYGDPYLTLTGVVLASGIKAENIRFKIRESSEDYSSVKPSVEGDRFTFSSIPLKSDLNTIVFYERQGAVENTLLTFYVMYNDTPLITAIRVNDIPLPPLGDQETMVEIMNPDRMMLTIMGEGKNIDRIEIKNNRSNETPVVDVVSGTFATRLPAAVGLNVLSFRAFKGNKEVYYIERKIIVTLATEGGHLLYDLVAGGGSKASNPIALDPERTTEVPVTISGGIVEDDTGAGGAGFSSLTGKLVIKFTDTQQDKLVGYKIIARRGAEEKVLLDQSAQTQGTPYSWKTSLGGLTADGGPWQIYAAYVIRHYEDPNTPAVFTETLKTVPEHLYSIQLVDQSQPRFLSVTDRRTGKHWQDGMSVDVPVLPLTLDLETLHMGNASDMTLTFAGEQLKAGDDYTLSLLNRDHDSGRALYRLTINRLPAKNGVFTIDYTDAQDASKQARFSVQMRVLITPYISLFATIDGKRNVVDRNITLNPGQSIGRLEAIVYNYTLKPDGSNIQPSNVALFLNDTDLSHLLRKSGDKLTIDVNHQDFKLKPGTNTLKIILTDEPRTEFTYDIRFLNEAISMITDTTLKVIENKKTVELKPAAGSTVYRTSAMFLSEFSFRVSKPQSGQVLEITKGADVIARYMYDGLQWRMQPLGSYLDSLPDFLRPYADPLRGYNFPETVSGGSVFRGGLRPDQYALIADAAQRINDLTERAQQEGRLPFTLNRYGQTHYTLTLYDGQGGALSTTSVTIERTSSGWLLLAPLKDKPTDPYPIVNTNSIDIRLYAENASKVMIGKTEATTFNTTTPDLYFDAAIGDLVPRTYYVFTAQAQLKPGLNKIPLQITIDGQTYKDTVLVFHANASVTGAEYIDVLGKNVKFSVFDKSLTLTFPKGTVLIAPPAGRADDEYIDHRQPLYTDVPIYFALADRQNGQVIEPVYGQGLSLALTLPANFIYASPLYFIDAGDTEAPGGRDPYMRYGEGERRIGDAAPSVRMYQERTYDNLIPTARGTLTLTYESSIVLQSANEITVFYHDGRSWHNLGGVVDPKKRTVTVPFIRFGYYMVMKQNQSFTDIVTHPFARNALDTMYAKGIMPNFSAVTFGAMRPMSRGELTTALVKALDLPINAGPYDDPNGRYPLEPTFYDVTPSSDQWDYAYKYIETAARAGIVSGTSPGFFRPNDQVTREQAAIMIARAMNLKLPATPDAARATLAKVFVDTNQMNVYALPAIAAVYKAGLMEGSPLDPNAKKTMYAFNPRASITRAEMAVILQKMMIQMKKLPKQ